MGEAALARPAPRSLGAAQARRDVRADLGLVHSWPTAGDAGPAQARRRQVRGDMRARRLLERALTPVQLAQLADHGAFVVETPAGHFYELTRGRSGNVYRLEAGPEGLVRTARYCCHPTEPVPDWDTLLAQKLWLETAEPEFLQLANRHTLDVRWPRMSQGCL